LEARKQVKCTLRDREKRVSCHLKKRENRATGITILNNNTEGIKRVVKGKDALERWDEKKEREDELG